MSRVKSTAKSKIYIKHFSSLRFLTDNCIFRLRYGLLNWGDKFSAQEVKDAFDNMEIDKKGMIDTEDLISMVLGSGDDE